MNDISESDKRHLEYHEQCRKCVPQGYTLHGSSGPRGGFSCSDTFGSHVIDIPHAAMCEIEHLKAKLATATTIIDSLPKTRDGVVIVHGMPLFFAVSNGVIEWEALLTSYSPMSLNNDRSSLCERCYSTREAAEGRQTNE